MRYTPWSRGYTRQMVSSLHTASNFSVSQRVRARVFKGIPPVPQARSGAGEYLRLRCRGLTRRV